MDLPVGLLKLCRLRSRLEMEPGKFEKGLEVWKSAITFAGVDLGFRVWGSHEIWTFNTSYTRIYKDSGQEKTTFVFTPALLASVPL